MTSRRSTHLAPQPPRWTVLALRAAGVYNLIWGAAVILFPLAFFRLADLPEPTYPSIWQCVGMIVGVYGVGYLVAARDPNRHWPIVLVGLLGKIFGPIGFVITATRGELPWSFGWTIIFNDLIWWAPFGVLLWSAMSAAQMRVSADDPGLMPSDAMTDATDQHDRSLAERSRERPHLVVFLRHFGCTFCKEALADLKQQRAAIEADGVGIACVHMSPESDAAAFFAAYDLGDVPRFSDPDRRLYRAFELQRGRFTQLFGWRSFVRGVAATFGGHAAGKLQGDGFQMPGAFLVADGEIVRAFRHDSAGDRPDYCELAASPAPQAAAG